eukprot:Rhum_TRINITY_DN16988_c0_g1::Rhum_TRINITY_DN16988_c0_g1_i1::g.164959::m.164959/K07893/RAB6A; Ras-related protein Rab-6A
MSGGSQLSPFRKYKVVFLGDSAVGKTSIITRFMYDTFETSYQYTIGIDFLSKNIKVGNKVLRMQLWDTAGQERYRSMIPSYIRDSKVAVVVYDVTSRASFDAAEGWIDGVRSERGTDALIVLCGNKIDRPAEERQVSTEQGQAKAEALSALFVEASAKTEQNVGQIFVKVATKLLEGQDEGDGSQEAAPPVTATLDPFVVNPEPAVQAPKSTCSGCM